MNCPQGEQSEAIWQLRKDNWGCCAAPCSHVPCFADALQSYLQQVAALEYEEKPYYEGLQQLFKKPLEKMKASAYDPVDIKMVP